MAAAIGIATAARLPALMILAPAARVIKPRRVGSTGLAGLIADVFVGGVLCTRVERSTITVTPKKRRGRPATGRDPHVTARMPQSIIDQIERWAASNDASRSEAIRRLVELGLKAKK
jgi:hypothetical protein